MNADDLRVFSLLIALGLFFFIPGVLARLGYFRWIYAMKGHLVLTPPALVHVATLIGLAMMFLGFLPIMPISADAKLDLGAYCFVPLVILIYVLAIWQPWWLKPAWLRWLEREHGNIIELLWEDVRKDRWA
jgi:hypothetical protein